MDTINQAWGPIVNGTPMFILTKKIKAVKNALLLQRKQHKDSNRIIQSKELECLHSFLSYDPFNPSIQQEVKRLLDSIAEYQYLEEMDLRQKSRIQWLNQGDPNTSFFHQCKRRQSSNIIRSLKASSRKLSDCSSEGPYCQRSH